MVSTWWRARMAILAVLVLVTLSLPPVVHAQARIHVVQRGENLTRIAAHYGTTIQAIVQANGLRNANHIWVGQRLRIPGGGGRSSFGGGGGVHIVRRGENLTQIARRYGTSVSAIARANGLHNPNHIWVGQRLQIPGGGSGGGGGQGGGSVSPSGTVHVVRRGETLQGIALRYGTTAAAIATANSLRNPNYIWVGQRLRIPSGGGGGAAPPSGGGGRWIEVDLSSQALWAHQGSTVVRRMVVSTGIARYPTPTGRFRVYAKYPSVTMSGPGYYLPGVPHTMFFHRGYAIHGTYWHSSFGQPMSHGCINLTRADAAWLYGWAPVGTSIVIHW